MFTTQTNGKKGQKGFTLVELLIVVALVAISIGITSDILLSIIRSFNKTTVFNEIEQEANFVGLMIEKELRNAEDIITADGSFASINYINSDGQSTIIDCDGNSVFKYFQDESPSPQNAITANTVSVSDSDIVGGVVVQCNNNFIVRKGAGPGVPDVVEVNFVFSQETVGGDIAFEGDVEINNTVVVRGTY